MRDPKDKKRKTLKDNPKHGRLLAYGTYLRDTLGKDISKDIGLLHETTDKYGPYDHTSDHRKTKMIVLVVPCVCSWRGPLPPQPDK